MEIKDIEVGETYDYGWSRHDGSFAKHSFSPLTVKYVGRETIVADDGVGREVTAEADELASIAKRYVVELRAPKEGETFWFGVTRDWDVAGHNWAVACPVLVEEL